MEVNTTSTTDPVNYYNKLNTFILNPMVFVIVLLIIVAYFVFSSSLGNSESSSFSSITSSDSSGSGGKVMGIIIVIILVFLIIVNAFQYFFSVNITAYLTDFFTNEPKIDIVVDQNTNPSGSFDPSPAPVPEIKFKKQVFNIPGNYYNYTNAKALCQAYGSKLATYQQVEDAYKNSGEWCNYGWSDGQMALFPTQQKTFDTLQKIEGHENDCGRPGVNGGYMANPALKFGVNCFGYKPRINSTEEELMANEPLYPKTLKDIAMENRVNYWKDKLTTILVSPFNSATWSRL